MNFAGEYYTTTRKHAVNNKNSKKNYNRIHKPIENKRCLKLPCTCTCTVHVHEHAHVYMYIYIHVHARVHNEKR